MKYHFVKISLCFLALVIAVTTFVSCEKLNPAETIPAYIKINEIKLNVPADGSQGSSQSNFNCAWVYVDEELIGVVEKRVKQDLLHSLYPQYIILKPSLHGGIKGVKEWIKLAEMEGIQWWMTSALESNIGLSAICQFTAEFKNDLPQGLGTGSLYSNNIDKGLIVDKGYIYFGN